MLVFPNLDAANAAYKLLWRLGGAEVIGPILQGIAKPVHVLQRGVDVNDIVNMAAIAVLDAQERRERRGLMQERTSALRAAMSNGFGRKAQMPESTAVAIWKRSRWLLSSLIHYIYLILPAGTSKIGIVEYDVDLNGSPQTVAELNDLPIKTVGGAPIYIRDVAHVRNGYPPQTNIVRVDGQRAALMIDS